MQRFLLPLTLVLSLVVPGDAAAVGAQQFSLESDLLRELRFSIEVNILLELYCSDFEPVTNVHARHCGILDLDPDIAEVSYSWCPEVLYYSIWHPESNGFWAWAKRRKDLDDWIAVLRDDYDNSELSGIYPFREWLQLHVISETWRNYTYLIYLGGITGDFHSVDIEDSVTSMESLWGVTVHPQLEGVTRIVYEYRGAVFSWALVHDDIEFFSQEGYLRHARGEFREPDELIQGEIVL